MSDVVIVSAARTPIGKFGGALKSLTSVELGTIAAKAAIERAKISPKSVDQAIFGNVLQAGSGQNVARQIALSSGLDESSCAMTINEVCGSGLKAIRLAQSAICMGDAKVVVAGGTESMSNVPFYAQNVRFGGLRYGNSALVDGLKKDGLCDAFTGKEMGVTAENVAAKFGITRKQQDAFALKSHQKAVFAQNNGDFDAEITPVQLLDGTVINRDEHPRANTSMEKLSKLKTLFEADFDRCETGGMREAYSGAKHSPTVTAGNASGINDGAAALVLMSKDYAIAHGIDYLAEIVGFAEGGISPDLMGYAPKHVMERMLKNTGYTVENIDLFEINEAFAAQSIAVCQQLNINESKLNIRGGAIALGHPLGASGARILTTLLYALRDNHMQNGVAALCVGGGIGVSMQVRMRK
ncbi:acetyl-CoA C-acetyltransferase [Gardnerella vaginalis 315-A]|uniref:thiolase family protein n=1 Tax=Gardnerella vaginalis TaxID=2702 RepID=UPI00020D6AD7|nr:acetyl-CoA C-acyltransferase [Gardnerella vaginalis]EGL14559.1 acetyl-CoA C-acetyltransferase [Gardnerella vaginalis 315-A]MDK7211773.1 acetyl-CoA C-acyltransferase [Gardnerella vaginalis]MDK8338222.1 acetyl-CoA C-acyltransferase [Gardnerella vaginalis]NSX24212.1 acetyl-CoA C-acyltransferase [Gardnerella vaginalis]PKZ45095.1 acetyl-CoA C-acyltransferase [Gardnerella vaginalis]